MAAVKRIRRDPAFKAQMALAALRGEQSINELALQHGVHPNQIAAWKRHAQNHLASIFDKKSRWPKAEGKLLDELYWQIGQLKGELDSLRKRVGL